MKTGGKLFIGMGILLCLVGGMTFWVGTYYGTPGSENEEQEKASSDPGPNISADRSVAEKSGPEPKALAQKNPGDVIKPAVADSGNKEEPAVEIPAQKGDEPDHAEDEGKHKFTNNLIKETSPYLLQHAHNPVNWYAWGEEAFRKAKREDKPIFLSVGYSTCHWCHVMEHESFENEAIAKIMNEHFISIKVDREERPDVDQIYMSAVQMMTGSGGWPMSVFLTPDRKPFWGGTYFPPESKWGRPGFRQILLSLAKAYKEDRERINLRAKQLTQNIRSSSKLDISRFGGGSGTKTDPVVDTKITRAPVTDAARSYQNSFDRIDGGFGGAPKFPPKMSISILLREHFKTGNKELIQMATLTLDKMARGGIYDHLGGGFHRYSTDAKWLVPHFEKMLYDNALLARVYLDAYQVTDNPFYARVAREIFEYIMREMTDPKGGFYSATDADSEGEEGKYFIWKAKQIFSVLGDEDGQLFCAYYNIKGGGNFSSREKYHAGLNILHVPRAPEEVAKEAGLDVAEMERRLSSMRAKLLPVRAKRIPPGLDDKILTAWNGLMIASLARGYQVLGDRRYLRAAENAANFVLKNMTKDGRLLRTHRVGRSKLQGYVNDYAYFISGLIELYEATFDVKWLDRALALNEILVKDFWDDKEAGFFFTANDHEKLIARTKQSEDGALPAGNSIAVMNLMRLAKLTDNESYYKKAERTLIAFTPFMSRFPRGFASMVEALDFFVEGPKEIAIAGRPDAADTRTLLATIHHYYIPNRVLALVDPGSPKAADLGRRIPLLAGKKLIKGKAACFVCKNFACKLPVTTAAGVVQALGISKKK